MEVVDIVISILDTALMILSGKSKNYRNIDYILSFTISVIFVLVLLGNLKFETIIVCVVAAILMSTLFGTVSNILIKTKKRK